VLFQENCTRECVFWQTSANLGKPEPSPGSGNREGSVAAYLTASVTGLVTEAMTAALTAEPPPPDPVAFVAEYLLSKK
jgi:hypothetical protein